MMKSIQNTCLALLLAVAPSCGSDSAEAPTLNVDVFGYGPDFEGGVSFVPGLPNYSDAQTTLIHITQPLDRRMLETESFTVLSGKASLPEVTFGENLRLEIEILDGLGEVLASGATPIFDFDPADDRLNFRLQVSPTNGFAPVGSIVSRDGQREFTQTRFDYRGVASSRWLGRIGHGAARTSDGRIVVVGGGQPLGNPTPNAVSEFSAVHDDVQLFDPKTGYLTDLSWSDSANSVIDADRLFEPVVHATVTPIGDDRYLVAGGFTLRANELRPTNTLQVIDLKAPAGQRVLRLVSNDQSSQVLKKARGMHAAAYRAGDNSVVVSGGIGPAGNDDILDTFEVISLDTNTVSDAPISMQDARVGHTMHTMDDRLSAWVVGGRNASGVLKSTEVLSGNQSTAEGDMKTARFGHAVVSMSASGGALLAVIGGYTTAEGAATDTYEVGGRGRGFLTADSWRLNHARGGLTAVELPGTRDIIVLGGRTAQVDVLVAERLEFIDLTANQPYESRDEGTADSARYRPSAHVVSTGKVVLIGGYGVFQGNQVALDNCELFNGADPVDGGGVVVLE